MFFVYIFTLRSVGCNQRFLCVGARCPRPNGIPFKNLTPGPSPKERGLKHIYILLLPEQIFKGHECNLRRVPRYHIYFLRNLILFPACRDFDRKRKNVNRWLGSVATTRLWGFIGLAVTTELSLLRS
jgi:hypothetical protein